MTDTIGLVFPDLNEVSPWKKKKGQLCAYTGEGGFNFRLPDDDDAESGGWGDGTAHNALIKVYVLDTGTGDIEIVYSSNGTTLITETIGTKGNTGKWKWFKKSLASTLLPFHDLYANNGDASFRIQSDDPLHISALSLKERDTGATRLWEAGDAAPTAHPSIESSGYTDGVAAGYSLDEDHVIIKSGAVEINGGVLDSASITATQIANATITATQIANATITATQIANATITATQIANATITGAKIASATITGSNIANATIGGTNIANATITGSNIASGTITGSNIQDGTILSADIGSATIVAANIAAGTITGNEIASLTIAAGNIVNLTITAGQIANATITGAKIASATITGGLIASATISGSNISGGTITGSNIASGTITGANITASTITGSLIDNSTITGSNIAATTITAANIAATTITATQIASGTITAAQLSATAIDSMTITGATIRTASSGARTEMNASNLFSLGFGGIGGYDGSTVQWYAKNSDGKIYFAGGAGTLSAGGLKYAAAVGSSAGTKIVGWLDGSAEVATLGFWVNSGSPNTYRGLLGVNGSISSGSTNGDFRIAVNSYVGYESHLELMAWHSVVGAGLSITNNNSGAVVDLLGETLNVEDSMDIAFGTTTGTKLGTSANDKIGVWNQAPVARPSNYTQTYSTANKTHATRTAAALTDNTGGTVSTTLAAITAGASYAQLDMQRVQNALASLADQVNKIRNDSLDTAQLVNAILDDLQTIGWLN